MTRHGLGIQKTCEKMTWPDWPMFAGNKLGCWNPTCHFFAGPGGKLYL